MIYVPANPVTHQQHPSRQIDSLSATDHTFCTSCGATILSGGKGLGTAEKPLIAMARVASASTGNTSRPSSSSSTPSQSPCPTPRPGRHHARSHSQDEERFASSSALRANSAFTLSPPRRQSHQGTGSKFQFTPATSSISATAAPGPAATSSPAIAAVTPFPSGRTSADASPDSNDDDADSAQSGAVTPTSTADSSVASSPIKEFKTSSDSTAESLALGDEARLKKLLEAQAKRRPRLMRLTPAFASLPGRLSPQPPNTAPIVGRDGEGGIAFPSLLPPQKASQSKPDTTSSMPSPPVADPRRSKGVLEPASILQLDMTNLPTPSARDCSAPQSTTDLPELRTKSGRLVKPSLKSSSYFVGGRPTGAPASAGVYRAKSTPNTPSVPKAVQFDSKLEHIKVFKFKQRPTAISRSGSPEQTETETEEERDMFPFVNYGRRSPPTGLVKSPAAGPAHSSTREGRLAAAAEAEEQLVLRLPNFPSSARLSVDKDIFLERIYLAEDLRSVRGTVRVRNVHFEKWVAVRFTLDNWVTVNEVSAEYSESLNEGQSDRFSFSIKLNELLNWPRGAGQHETKTMFLCLRYRTGSNAEFWDNNDGANYQLDFRKRQLPPTPLPTPDVGGRLGVRSHSISGSNVSSAQARAISIARRSGVHGSTANKANGFVEDLRRELDRLKSDEEEANNPPIQFKKPAGIEAAQGLGFGSKQARASPPVSPGQRSGSPLWSGRYDWGDALRNSSTASTRARQSVYDYFTAKPAPPHNALLAAASVSSDGAGSGLAVPDAPHVMLSEASPMSAESSSAPTPTLNSFGPIRAGMFSPAVGDVFAHHRPMDSSATSSPDKLSVPGSGQSSGVSTPMDGSSPTRRVTTANFFSYPPQRRDMLSPATSEQASPADSDVDVERGDSAEQNGSPVTRSSSLTRRIITVPKSALRRTSVADKEDGLIIENYDRELTSPLSSTLSPTVSISSSVESDSNATTGVMTPDDATSIEENAGTPRLGPSRRWSPPPTAPRVRYLSVGAVPTAEEARPRSVADLSELIQKYCWSSEVTPGTAPIVNGAGEATDASAALYGFEAQTPPLSGSATPTLDV
ncbi:unnamed protein product [Parajaminaea phylloscopi]